jgi:signal transduction histidine kinase
MTSRHGPFTTNGRPAYRTAIVDVTDVKQRDAELEKYRQRLRSLTSELAMTEERERRRIATALHDNLGQVLALARIKLGGLAKTCGSGLDGAASAAARDIAQLQQLLGDAIRQTRSLTLELSPPVLSLGLEAAVEWLGEQNRQHGLTVELRSFLRSPRMPEEVKLLLFQAVRELLNNVIKHAHASRALVTLRNVGGRIEATVEDDGAGMPQAGDDPFLMRGDGFGLFSLRTRLEHLGGSLHISTPHGGGTLVTVNVPSEPEKGAGGVAEPEANGAAASLTRLGKGGSNAKGVTTDEKPTGLENPTGRRPPDRPRGAAERARGRAGHDGRGRGG